MKAAVVRAFGAPLVAEDRPDPEPGPGQARIRVETSGPCHTDIPAAHRDRPARPTPPFVPAHEGVGAHCLSGRETQRERQTDTGYGRDGGPAERMPAWADFDLHAGR